MSFTAAQREKAFRRMGLVPLIPAGDGVIKINGALPSAQNESDVASYLSLAVEEERQLAIRQSADAKLLTRTSLTDIMQAIVRRDEITASRFGNPSLVSVLSVSVVGPGSYAVPAGSVAEDAAKKVFTDFVLALYTEEQRLLANTALTVADANWPV